MIDEFKMVISTEECQNFVRFKNASILIQFYCTLIIYLLNVASAISATASEALCESMTIRHVQLTPDIPKN